jgi:hypothetical protein
VRRKGGGVGGEDFVHVEMGHDTSNPVRCFEFGDNI